MHYTIQLCFAPQSLAMLTSAFFALDSPVTRGGDRPHLSLIVYNIPEPSLQSPSLGQDEMLDHIRDVTRLLDSVVAQTLAFPVTLSGIGQFPTDEHVVYLAPTVTEKLLGFHRRFIAQLQPLLKPPVTANAYYIPGDWVPHVAVSLASQADKERILPALARQPVFGEHQISAIEFINFPHGRLLHRAELQP